MWSRFDGLTFAAERIPATPDNFAKPGAQRYLGPSLRRALGALAKAHPGATAVLIDEVDARSLQRRSYLGLCVTPAAQRSILGLQTFYCRDGNTGCSCQLLLRPSQECARRFDLAD
jgi:hypothetical protein